MKLTVFLLFFLLLGACRSAPERSSFRPLPDTVPKQAKSIETVLNIPQKTLNADIVRAQTDERVSTPLVGPLGTGLSKLVDRGINRSRNSTAREAVAPVLVSLTGFDMNEVFRAAFQKELKTLAWTGNGPVTVNTKDDDEVLENLYRRGRQDGFLSLDCEYKLSPTFDTMMIEVKANLIPRSTGLRRIQAGLYEDSTHINDRKGDKVIAENALYSQTIVFLHAAPERLKELGANAALWAKNDGEEARKALNNGAAAVAAVITKSLNASKALTAESAEKFVPQEGYVLDINGSTYHVGQQKSGPGMGTTYVSLKGMFTKPAPEQGVPTAAVGEPATPDGGR